ncbi:tripartite tricarboxylate transporter substrate binding protein [Bradyrhizobium sp. LHD-71]|uniref:Bug family tripartite tricarboxylate transporter substrate binding protein n=1 Tax=Bradyrhizobium sp. LHD-71 TaxID=3072141 RepID=UPI00280C5F52|nr:tripartite tricarboxylate transporter substrate binding protein [Bradyrhizobium sp. LHD-71]MDQ8729700.1 tripartite tricarboxylate transporter substrate binding protein [Bradyrhizobium sp. LHD-71]
MGRRASGLHQTVAALTLITLLSAPTVRAQEDFPSKRFELIIPYGAGAATDAFARIVAEGLGRQTGQPIIAINRPGANQMIAVRAALAAPADGYTVLMLASGVVIEQVLKKDVNFDVRKDVVPIARAAQAPLGLFVSNSLPVSSVKELIDYVKKNPGKINYASAGVGSIAHLTTERFKLATGTDLVHVPYPGGTGPISIAMITGDVGVFINEMGSMRALAADGKIKALAALANTRSLAFPDVPAISEVGIPELQDIFFPFFFGFFVAPGTDPTKVEKLATAVNAALADPATRERLVTLGYDPALLGGTKPSDFRKIVNEELARVETVVRDARIPAQ